MSNENQGLGLPESVLRKMLRKGDGLKEKSPPFAIDVHPEFAKIAYDEMVKKYTESDPLGFEQHQPGAKLDAGKVQAGLLLDFGRSLMAVAQVLDYGATKYTIGGWHQVPDGKRRYTDAMMRHLLAQDELDPDSGLPHSYHIAWNALARLEMELRGKE